jgi:hypothetical protein
MHNTGEIEFEAHTSKKLQTGSLFSLRDAPAVIEVTTHEKAAEDDKNYWRNATPEQRLQEVETIRRVLYGDAVDQRLRGPLQIIECPWG